MHFQETIEVLCWCKQFPHSTPDHHAVRTGIKHQAIPILLTFHVSVLLKAFDRSNCSIQVTYLTSVVRGQIGVF